jgi:hypothetical protein
MECPTAEALLVSYSVVAMEYFGAADDLANLVGSHSKFKVAQQHAQQLHAKCLKARSALEEHRLEHGCNMWT